MSGTSQQITIGPKDAAWIVRENGEMELMMPKLEELQAVPENQIVLIGCAAGFQDDRLRELAVKILSEKQQPPN